jgi:hypothetical protein
MYVIFYAFRIGLKTFVYDFPIYFIDEPEAYTGNHYSE